MKQQPDGVAGAPPDPEPLRSVPPSQMGSLRACALSALWSAHADSAATARSARRTLNAVAEIQASGREMCLGMLRDVRRLGNGEGDGDPFVSPGADRTPRRRLQHAHSHC